ncbi:MAG TPA: ABC transporter permease [Aggregatilineales bacterium]|nr:ABC transporter permease [Aggregatilineales bacterium]
MTTNLIRTSIRPRRGWQAINVVELWHYRDLLFFLAWRDISVRYKQTVLGATWAVLQPIVSMIVFSLFFGSFMHIASDGAPYPLFSYAALLPWGYFSSALTSTAQSLIDNQRLLVRVYFPRLIIPLAAVLPPLLDFLISFTVLSVMIVGYSLFGVYHAAVTINLLFLPGFLLLALVTALGVGLWISALNVQYRDFRYVTGFLVQVWLFASPVAYSSSIVPLGLRSLYGINPMVGVINGFRWALLGTGDFSPATFIVSTVVAIGLLVSGTFYFRRVEKIIADVV